ncbi:hypothetical protein [Mucilaginibacter lacusdianchii]|uniref:hypothetical protein n=1 Tax=Mucilaginibacter lacusdianchii TaxID=2684211 RepID=UPI00131E9EA2|nr:hypothetical protein [Mucilaginibacter sp. JXJ CY 39]
MKSLVKKTTKKIFTTVLLFSSIIVVKTEVKAQSTDVRTGIMWNAMMAPASKEVYYDRINKIDGSPFFQDQFMETQAITNDGKRYKIEKAKLDLVNQFLVADESENSTTPSNPIFVNNLKSIVIKNKNGSEYLFESGFPAVNGNGEMTLYQVLGGKDGKLLRLFTKKTAWRKSYGTQQEYVTNNISYYIYKNNSMSELKKDKDSILSVFSDKSQQLSNYIDSHKLKISKDKDLDELIAYYNTL